MSPEPLPIAFAPKWLCEPDADDFDGPIAFGAVPDQSPRVVTRLVPKDHGMSLPARTVSKVIDLKQSLALYAARDVVLDVNPGFADLRTLPAALTAFGQLSVEPSEVGSYVIPARFDAPPTDGVDAEAIARRFAELLNAVSDPAKAAAISLGALRACRELGKLLGREVESIEVATYDRRNDSLNDFQLTRERVRSIDARLKERESRSEGYEVITGVLDAIDIGKNEFYLKQDGRERVRGTASFPIQLLRHLLGEQISVEGRVVREGRKTTITAYSVEEFDVPSQGSLF